MVKLLILILLISINYGNIFCSEESSDADTTSDVSEKTELLFTDQESSRSSTENYEAEDKASEASDGEEINGEEIRVSRSSMNETNINDSSELQSTEIPLTDRTASSEANEIGKKTEKDAQESQNRNSSPELDDNTKSGENTEKQEEGATETSRSAPETEDKIAEDSLEASAESKVSNIEKDSSKIDDTDRSSEIEEINEKSNESGLDKNLPSRRMFSRPDFLITDTKTNAEANSNVALNNSSRNEPTPATKATPVIPHVATEEILNAQFLPKIYPHPPELNINYPNINSDFQGPRDLPIYLQVRPDEHSKYQVAAAQKLQLKSPEENKKLNTMYQQQYNDFQRSPYTQTTSANKQFEDLPVNRRQEVPNFYLNSVPMPKVGIENNQVLNSNQGSRNQFQQFNQNLDKTNSDYKVFENLKFEDLQVNRRQEVPSFYLSSVPAPKVYIDNNQLMNTNQGSGHQFQQFNQYSEKINSDHKVLENLHREPRNQMQDMLNHHLLRQPQEYTNSKVNSQNKQSETERYANSYTHEPLTYNDNYNTNPKTTIYSKLLAASKNPNQSHTFNSNTIRNYPHLINHNYRTDFSVYGNGHTSLFQHPAYTNPYRV